MAKHYLRRFFFLLLALISAMYGFAHDLVLHLLQRYGAKAFGEQGLLAQQPSWRYAAIVALRGDTAGAPFIANLLNGLAENGFFILAVTAGMAAPTFKREILPHCHHLLENFAFGHDSSIKAGWDWIRQRDGLKHIDALAIADDSFYYPRRIVSTIPQMLGRMGDWLSLFEIPAQRAQNGLQIFRPAVLASQAFQMFWQNYALTAGGNALPAILRRAAFAPQTYYNAARLDSDLATALSNENVPADLQDVLNLTLGFERHDKNSRMRVRDKDALALPAEDVIVKIHTLAERTDPAHAVGLLCNYLYQAPLKRDISRHLVLNSGDLMDLVQGFSAEEKEAMANDLRRKTAVNFGSLQKIPQGFSNRVRLV